MKILKVAAFAAAAAVATALSAAPGTSMVQVPQSGDPASWWQKRFAEKQELVKAGGSDVVFIGDSIVHGLEGSAVWREKLAVEPYKALNLGFSGDRTEHVLWRLNHGELEGYKAKVFVVMIGTNNTGHRSADQESPIDTIAGVWEIVKRLRSKQPQAKVILQPIFPRGELPTDEKRVRNEAVNYAIRQMADNQDVFLCDINDRLLDERGVLHKEVCPDFLHPGDKGQRIWVAALIPMIDRLLKEAADETPVPARAISRPIREYADRLADRRRAIGKNAGGEFDVVCLGDSITHFWDGNGKQVWADLNRDYAILNLGHGGDRTEHLIWRFLNGELDGYKAKLFMLMIGTNNNNRGDNRPEDVALGVKRILEIVKEKHPESKILLLPIFPRGENAKDSRRIKNEKTNAIIKDYADGKTILWCDFNDKFLVGEDKVLPRTLMPDLLHPNNDGYRIWEEAVRPYFKEVCGK